MNLGLGQILFIILVGFLLFGNLRQLPVKIIQWRTDFIEGLKEAQRKEKEKPSDDGKKVISGKSSSEKVRRRYGKKAKPLFPNYSSLTLSFISFSFESQKPSHRVKIKNYPFPRAKKGRCFPFGFLPSKFY